MIINREVNIERVGDLTGGYMSAGVDRVSGEVRTARDACGRSGRQAGGRRGRASTEARAGGLAPPALCTPPPPSTDSHRIPILSSVDLDFHDHPLPLAWTRTSSLFAFDTHLLSVRHVFNHE